MLSFLLSFALAADVPAGARVVLPASAPVTTVAGKPLLSSSGGTWGARVVQDLGDRLVVEPESNACQRSLAMSPAVLLRVAVDESALLTLTNRALSGKGTAGEEWQLGAGVVVREGMVDLGAVGRLKLPLPVEALGTWTTDALLPVTFPDGDLRVGPPRGPLMFLGQPLSVVDDLTIHQEKDRVSWKGACGGISFLLPATVPFGEPVNTVGGVLGGLGTFPMAKVPAGATLLWPDGERAGKSLAEIQLSNTSHAEGIWCGNFRLDSRDFQLCTSEVVELTTEGPDSTSTSFNILPALAKPEIEAVVRANRKQIWRCYPQNLNKGINGARKVTILFAIVADGTVDAAQVKQTSIYNNTIEACIVRVVKQMIFPQPRGGGTVNYPFYVSI